MDVGSGAYLQCISLQGRDDDDGLGPRIIISYGEINLRDHAIGYEVFKPLEGSARVSVIVGFPDGRLVTPISRQNTPLRNPVPSAFEQASLEAKRFA